MSETSRFSCTRGPILQYFECCQFDLIFIPLMESHNGESIQTSLSGGVFECVFFTAELPIEQDGTFFTSCTNDENIIVSDHGLGAAACMVPIVDLLVCASRSWAWTIQKVHFILILLRSIVLDYLKMGCIGSHDQCQVVRNIQQATDLQYSRKILEVVLDTLYTIDRKFSQCMIGQSQKLLCGIDSSYKDVRELKIQLELMVMLFSVSKERLKPQEFTYDDALSKEIATGVIEQNIRYFKKQDQEIAHICEVLLDTLKGIDRPQLKKWTTNIDSENPQKTVNKKLLKDGMKATQMKEKIEADINNKFKTIPVENQ